MSGHSEDLLQNLRLRNPTLDIRRVSESEFAPYGSVLEDEGIPALVSYLWENTPIGEGSAYIASDEAAEKLPIFEALRRKSFGGLDIQIGWCNGTNTRLNALEYHASAEVNVVAADAVLLLARKADCREGQLDTSAVRGFYLEAGQAVLLESSTLHFAPCAVDSDGFRVAVILPRGTNTPLEERVPSDKLLWMKNKWLLAHSEAARLVEAGALVGLTGSLVVLRREE